MPTIANVLRALALRLGFLMSVTFQTHRPGLQGPFKSVAITAQTTTVVYGLRVFDDGRMAYELDHHPVDRLPNDGVAERLLETYDAHRSMVRDYLQTQAYDVWHTLTASVEACSERTR